MFYTAKTTIPLFHHSTFSPFYTIYTFYTAKETTNYQLSTTN